MSESIRNIEQLREIIEYAVESAKEDKEHHRPIFIFELVLECLDELLVYKRQEQPTVIQEGWNAE